MIPHRGCSAPLRTTKVRVFLPQRCAPALPCFSHACATAPYFNSEELPWQVIYIGDRNMVRNLMAHQQHHDRVINTALLAAPPPA